MFASVIPKNWANSTNTSGYYASWNVLAIISGALYDKLQKNRGLKWNWIKIHDVGLKLVKKGSDDM